MAEAEVCTLDGDGRSALEWAVRPCACGDAQLGQGMQQQTSPCKEWRGRGHVVQVLQRHERLHRLLDQQRATAHAEMFLVCTDLSCALSHVNVRVRRSWYRSVLRSSQLFTAEARMAQLGKELAISSQDSSRSLKLECSRFCRPQCGAALQHGS